MHRAMRAWQWSRSSVAKMWQEAHPKIKVASLLKKVNPQQSDGLIPTLAFLLGQWHSDCGSKASRQLSSQASHCSCSQASITRPDGCLP